MTANIPYAELDPKIVKLVRALNAYPCIETMSSCGGHENPTSCQSEAGGFYVSFYVEKSERGWRVLEFLAWAINNDYSRGDYMVILYPHSSPPFLNTPGDSMHFTVQAHGGADPDDLARFLTMVRKDYLKASLRGVKNV